MSPVTDWGLIAYRPLDAWSRFRQKPWGVPSASDEVPVPKRRNPQSLVQYLYDVGCCINRGRGMAQVLPVFYGADLEGGTQRHPQRRGEASRATCLEMVSGPRPELQRKGARLRSWLCNFTLNIRLWLVAAILDSMGSEKKCVRPPRKMSFPTLHSPGPAVDSEESCFHE